MQRQLSLDEKRKAIQELIANIPSHSNNRELFHILTHTLENIEKIKNWDRLIHFFNEELKKIIAISSIFSDHASTESDANSSQQQKQSNEHSTSSEKSTQKQVKNKVSPKKIIMNDSNNKSDSENLSNDIKNRTPKTVKVNTIPSKTTILSSEVDDSTPTIGDDVRTLKKKSSSKQNNYIDANSTAES